MSIFTVSAETVSNKNERVVVFVQLKPGYRAKTSEADYLDFLKDKVVKYAVPKSVVFLEEVPLTHMHKVDKKQLWENFAHSQRARFHAFAHTPIESDLPEASSILWLLATCSNESLRCHRRWRCKFNPGLGG